MREVRPFPIYNVGWCDLGINGNPCKTRFKSASLAPFDVILGESSLREHRDVLDYADNRLWQKDLAGNLTPLNFNMPTPSHTLSGALVRKKAYGGVYQSRLPSSSFGLCQGVAGGR